jgi:hypothetical protein
VTQLPLIYWLRYVVPVIEEAAGGLNPWLFAFLHAYVRAGLVEESLKYSAIRAPLWNDFVADPRGMFVYACAAANAVAGVENLM